MNALASFEGGAGQDSRLNPYCGFVAGRDVFEVLRSTADRLRGLVGKMTPEQIESPWAFGKWSPREIVAHLADCEVVFSFRLRQTLAGVAGGAVPVLQPFDQGIWAERYAGYDVGSGLELFAAARGWNLLLLATVSAAEGGLPVEHPERGTMTFRVIVETMAGHDLNHLRQVETVASG